MARAHADFQAKCPDQYLCPITYEIMKDPVITSGGFTYERSAIENWFALGHQKDPLTNAPLANKNLTPNHTLKSLIEEWKADQKKKAEDAKAQESKRVSAPRLPVQTPSSHVRTYDISLDIYVEDIPPRELKDMSLQELERIEIGLDTMSIDMQVSIQNSFRDSKESLSPSDAFLQAVKSGSVLEAKKYFNRQVNREIRDAETGETLLIIATKARNILMMKFLCEDVKVDINAFDLSHDTALFYAIRNRDEAGAKLLLSRGANSFSVKHEGVSLHTLGRTAFDEWSQWPRPSAPNAQHSFHQAAVQSERLQQPQRQGSRISHREVPESEWISSLRRYC